MGTKWSWSEEAKKKKSEQLRQYYIDHPEAKDVMRKAQTGRKHTPEHIEAGTAHMKGNQYTKGRAHSEEEKEKIGSFSRGKKHPEDCLHCKGGWTIIWSKEQKEAIAVGVKRAWEEGRLGEASLEGLQSSKIRQNPNPNEKKLLAFIKYVYPGYEVVSEYSILRYSGDVAIPELNLIFEADGRYWYSRIEDIEYDMKRDMEIGHCGWGVIRLWEDEVEELYKTMIHL